MIEWVKACIKNVPLTFSRDLRQKCDNSTIHNQSMTVTQVDSSTHSIEYLFAKGHIWTISIILEVFGSAWFSISAFVHRWSSFHNFLPKSRGFSTLNFDKEFCPVIWNFYFCLTSDRVQDEYSYCILHTCLGYVYFNVKAHVHDFVWSLESYLSRFYFSISSYFWHVR